MEQDTHESFESLKEMEQSLENELQAEVTDLGDGQLAVGYKVPTGIKTPLGFLDQLRSMDDLYNDIYKQMIVSNRLYKYNAIIGNAVDVLTEFAISPIDVLPTGDKKLDKILNWWLENINQTNTNGLPGIHCLLHEVALEWFTSGNVFPYQKWDNVEIEKVPGVVKLPNIINLLNPQSIHIHEEPLAFGQEIIYLKPDSKIVQKILMDGRSDPEAAILKAAIPRSLVQSIKNVRGSFYGNIRLNPQFVDHLKRKVKGYQAWGVPYLARCFAEASLLERLRQMDEQVATGLLNLVTIFKIGTEEHPATPARLQRFATLLKNPKASTTLVWAHDIEVIQVGPDGKILQFDKKYKESKENLLIALGIPPVLSSLSGGGDPWVAILALVERLQELRKILQIWLEKIMNRIAKENGFSDKRIVTRWHRMNLQDDSSVKNLLLAFYDRGLISVKDALEESGRNYDAVVAAKKDEKANSISDLFEPPMQPFQGNKTSDGRPSASSPKMSKESTNKTKVKPVRTDNLKTQTKKTPSSKVK